MYHESGEYDFMMRESDDYLSVELEVKVSKFLDTSLIKLDIRPTVIRLLIKGRLLQLTIPEEVRGRKACLGPRCLWGCAVRLKF